MVFWILVRTWERAWVGEVIEIGAERIEVTQQRHKRIRQFELETAWAVIELIQPEVAWYGPKVILRSGAQVIELGMFLTGEEKLQLVRHLQSAIKKHSAMKGASNF